MAAGCGSAGGWWDRLRRVDHQITDALSRLGMELVGVLGFALLEASPDEPPAANG